MGFAADITGKQFGYLTAIKYSYKVKRRHYWTCRCKCGTVRDFNKSKIMNGESKSCGCYCKERTSLRRKIHGMSKSRFYGVWNDMMMRCYNPTRHGYDSYGGRGIKVEKRWHTIPDYKEQNERWV